MRKTTSVYLNRLRLLLSSEREMDFAAHRCDWGDWFFWRQGFERARRRLRS